MPWINSRLNYLTMKRMKPYHIIYISILLPGLVSCSKDDSPAANQPQYMLVAEKASANSMFTVSFYAKDSLFVGYNKLFFKVTDKSSGSKVSQAQINFRPVMDMVTFKHACPIENPAVNANADGYFEGAVMFSMPGYNGSWSL